MVSPINCLWPENDNETDLPFFRLGITLTPKASSVTRHKDRVNKQYLALHPIFTMFCIDKYYEGTARICKTA